LLLLRWRVETVVRFREGVAGVAADGTCERLADPGHRRITEDSLLRAATQHAVDRTATLRVEQGKVADDRLARGAVTYFLRARNFNGAAVVTRSRLEAHFAIIALEVVTLGGNASEAVLRARLVQQIVFGRHPSELLLVSARPWHLQILQRPWLQNSLGREARGAE